MTIYKADRTTSTTDEIDATDASAIMAGRDVGRIVQVIHRFDIVGQPLAKIAAEMRLTLSEACALFAVGRRLQSRGMLPLPTDED